MKLRVRNLNGEWCPAGPGEFDATIEVDDEVGKRYLQLNAEYVAMTIAIEAQVHGTASV